MGWERRRHKSYYYIGERRGGRVTKRYLGNGELARGIAYLDYIDASRRQEAAVAWQRERADLQEREASVDEVQRDAYQQAATWLEALGYHRPGRGRWRRKRCAAAMERSGYPLGAVLRGREDQESGGHTMAGKGEVMASGTQGVPGPAAAIPASSAALSGSDLAALRQRAVRGMLKSATKAERAAVRQALESIPPGELIAVFTESVATAGALAGGGDEIRSAYAKREVEDLAAQLAGPGASAVERLLATRVAVAQLHVAFVEHQLSCVLRGDTFDPRKAEFWDRALCRASRRQLDAVRVLAQVRGLGLPQVALQVNQQVTVGAEPTSSGRVPFGCREGLPHGGAVSAAGRGQMDTP